MVKWISQWSSEPLRPVNLICSDVCNIFRLRLTAPHPKKDFFGDPDNSIMVPHDRPNFLQHNINHAPMVKWISQWSSEPLWRVRVLLGAPNEGNPNSLDCFFILFIKVYIKAKIKLLSFILIKHFKKNCFCSILYIKRIVYERT